MNDDLRAEEKVRNRTEYEKGGNAMILILMPIILIVIIFIVIAIMASRYIRVPPNKAMVVYGHKFKGNEGMIVLTAGGRFIAPIIEQWGWLHLDVRTVDLRLPRIITKDHYEVVVHYSAQVQIDPNPETIKRAAVMLLNKPLEEIDMLAYGILDRSC